ncbi:DUF4030 domain-containing protein [Lysinibacillus endophyticus]|uniref:DUF4030 domain-containing protein n=1 Tax=Ureibacillus endophyticus TaxID=1978490 RepID=UPI0020A1903A|nr:DUF4030 domain-containing protein [Lysinibacillus endophyticus]MCP1143459.1 DUF4030 domain-containing protein [Lysinibacillus endophyticus]
MKNKWNYPEQNDLKFEQKHKEYVFKKVGEIHETSKKSHHTFVKRMTLAATITFAMVALLIASTYVSPAMAKVVSNIPYISEFINKQERTIALNDTVYNVMNKHNYQLLDLQINGKKISITLIGTDQEIQVIKNEVVSNVDTALQEKNLGHFSIDVKAGEVTPWPEDDPETVQMEKASEALHDEIMALLDENHFEPAFPIEARVNNVQNFIYVAVPNTESKERMEQLKELLKTASSKYGDDFKMRITQIDMKAREQELRWGGNIHAIGSALMENKDFNVTGFSYSFHPYPLMIKLKTSIKSTDPNVDELVERIENEITQFLKNDERTKDIRNDPYDLIIMSKDKKRLN